MYSCCKALHPFWPTTCFCRGEVKSREAAETKQKAKELCEFKRKAKQLAESERKAASNKKTKAAPTPNRFKFKSAKRPFEEEKLKSDNTNGVPKKGKVANDKEFGQIVTRSKVENPIPLPPALNPFDQKTEPFDYLCAKYKLTTDSQGLCKIDTKEKVETNEASAKYKFSTKNGRVSDRIDTKAKVKTNDASAKFDFRLVKKKLDIPSQPGAKTTTENLELKVKDLEAKVKVINQKKKDKAEKEKTEASHSKLKEKYKQLQDTFKRLKKEEREVKLQRNIKDLAEKCKNLEEKLHDEKLQINDDDGGVDEDNVRKTKRRSKKEANQKSRNKG